MKAQIAQINRGRSMLIGLRNIAANVGLKERDVRPQELVVYSRLQNNSDSLEFNINRRTASYVMETLLEENDMFVAHAMSIGIHKVLIDGNGLEHPGVTPVIYYPDPTWFSGPAVNFATEAQSLENIYNGLLRVETEQDIRLKEYRTDRFRTVPETQSSATTLFGQDGTECKDIYTGLAFWGGNRNDIELKFINGDYAAVSGVAANHNNYVVIRLKGTILVGGSKKVTAARLTQLLGDK